MVYLIPSYEPLLRRNKPERLYFHIGQRSRCCASKIVLIVETEMFLKILAQISESDVIYHILREFRHPTEVLFLYFQIINLGFPSPSNLL